MKSLSDYKDTLKNMGASVFYDSWITSENPDTNKSKKQFTLRFSYGEKYYSVTKPTEEDAYDYSIKMLNDVIKKVS